MTQTEFSVTHATSRVANLYNRRTPDPEVEAAARSHLVLCRIDREIRAAAEKGIQLNDTQVGHLLHLLLDVSAGGKGIARTEIDTRAAVRRARGTVENQTPVVGA